MKEVLTKDVSVSNALTEESFTKEASTKDAFAQSALTKDSSPKDSFTQGALTKHSPTNASSTVCSEDFASEPKNCRSVNLLEHPQAHGRINTAAGDLILSALRVVYSAEHKALMVADVHLGKARAFRQLGVPVPSGTTQGNLDRLSRALEFFKPQTLYFLGDLLHSRAAHHESLLEPLHHWRASHGSIEMVLVRGNHDDAAGDPPKSLGVQVVEEPFMLGQFALCHHPQNDDAKGFSLAGHVHPVTVLKGKGRSRIRLSCFAHSANQLILPAFGEFTGGYLVKADARTKVYPLLGSE